MDNNNVCDLLRQLVNLLSKASSLNVAFFSAPNPVTVKTGVPQIILQSNPDRKFFRIVNLGTTVINVFTMSPDAGLVPLNACGVANDGTGGVLTDELWQGVVYAGSIASNGSIYVTEGI